MICHHTQIRNCYIIPVHSLSRINQLMRSACSESVQYGDQLLADGSNNRRVIVILNPTAKKRSAEKAFEKYCGPGTVT